MRAVYDTPDASEPADSEAERPSPPSGRRRHRARWWIAGAAACALALAGGGAVAVNAAESAPDSTTEELPHSTAAVEEGTLSGTQTVPGTLDYANVRGIASQFEGILTEVPAAGTQLKAGDALFAVDNESVYLFTGQRPAWRAFESYMSDGPDVKQLESNLKKLGYFGYEPDEEFTWDTRVAIQQWQEQTGQEETGRVDLGRIVFAAGSVRIAEIVAAIGDRVGPGGPVVNISDLIQEVSADLKLADQKLGVIDAKVDVQLPGGTSTTGTITHVGQPTERENNGETSVVIPMTISLDNPEDANGIQRANVTVDVPSETRENVLSVPVDALIALPGGGFGVETVGKGGALTKIPVETGLFAGGRVEVTGKGIDVGLEVVVPE